MLQTIADRLDVELDAETREKVADEQLRMVWSHATVATLVASAFAMFAAFHLMGVVDLGLIQFWITLKLAIAAPRVIQAQIFRRRGFPGGRSWRLSTYWLLAVDGGSWEQASSSLHLPLRACVALPASPRSAFKSIAWRRRQRNTSLQWQVKR